MTAGDHYFSEAPRAPSSPRTVTLHLPDRAEPLRLHTDAAVFSGRAVDPGTAQLLTHGARPDPDRAQVLVDLGCGYGPIAVALALWAPHSHVWAVEVNDRARELCRRNAEAHGVGARVTVVAPDEVPPELSVDGLWSNPPVRVGKERLHALLDEWLGRLGPEGAAHLVVARNLGADSLARWLVDHGHRVERRGSRRGYRLLDVGPAGRGPVGGTR